MVDRPEFLVSVSFQAQSEHSPYAYSAYRPIQDRLAANIMPIQNGELSHLHAKLYTFSNTKYEINVYNLEKSLLMSERCRGSSELRRPTGSTLYRPT